MYVHSVRYIARGGQEGGVAGREDRKGWAKASIPRARPYTEPTARLHDDRARTPCAVWLFGDA